MMKFALNIGVFLFGVLLSAVVVYTNPRLAFEANVQPAEEPAQHLASAPIEEVAVVRLSTSEEEELRKTLPVGKGLQRLLDALDEGSLESVSVVRSEFLYTIPNYQSVLLPALKERALKNLLRRFSVLDWQDWPRAAFAIDNGPTMARAYVNDVGFVNRDLGVVLETAAQLFHRLYLATKYGKVFDLDEGMRSVLNDAELLVQNRGDRGLPAQYFFTPSLIVDPIFVREFERERGRLVTEYARQHPDAVAQTVALVNSLRAEYVEPAVYPVVINVLNRVSRDGSAQFRKELVASEESGKILAGFGREDSRVAEALAHLFAVSAVDALEKKELLRAKQLLVESIVTRPGLPVQKQVHGFLKQYKLGDLGAAIVSLKEKGRQVAASETKAMAGTIREKRSILPVGLALLLLVAGASVIGAVVYYFRWRAASVTMLDGDSSMTYHDWGGSESRLSVIGPLEDLPLSMQEEKKVVNLPG